MIDEVAVVVPARDEQDTLPGCLRALVAAAHQLREIRPPIAVQLVIAISGAAVVHEYEGFDGLTVVPVKADTAGGARAAGVAHALAATNGSLKRIWLANTDADSLVPSDWLIEMVADAERGAHLVLGTVLPDEELEPGLRRLWRDQHRLIEGHPHVHGANFGIRADVYRRLGGWLAAASGEDVDLARRAEDHPNLVIIRTPRVPVVTSSRLISRAPGGFAAYLSVLAATAVAEQAC